MDANDYEFEPEVLNKLWNSVPEVRDRFGVLTGGALLQVLRQLILVWKERGDLLLEIEGLEEALLLSNDAYNDLLNQHLGGESDGTIQLVRD